MDAVELFDRASLTECGKDEDMTRLVPDIVGADPMAAALLIECRGGTPEGLQERIEEVKAALLRAKLQVGAVAANPGVLDNYPFMHDVKDYKVGGWKGLGVVGGGGLWEGVAAWWVG